MPPKLSVSKKAFNAVWKSVTIGEVVTNETTATTQKCIVKHAIKTDAFKRPQFITDMHSRNILAVADHEKLKLVKVESIEVREGLHQSGLDPKFHYTAVGQMRSSGKKVTIHLHPSTVILAELEKEGEEFAGASTAGEEGKVEEGKADEGEAEDKGESTGDKPE